MGEEDLEKSLTKAGLRVLRPETLSLPEQIAAVREHEVIVGFQGSQLHTLAFSAGRKRVLCWGNAPVDGAYVTLDKLLGNVAIYLDAPQPSEYAAFIPDLDLREPFVVDPVQVAAGLEKILGRAIPVPELSKETRMTFAANWKLYRARRNDWVDRPTARDQRARRNLEIAVDAGM